MNAEQARRLGVEGEWERRGHSANTWAWMNENDALTIPTTERHGGVTSCAFCGAVVDIEYPEDAGEPTEEGAS